MAKILLIEPDKHLRITISQALKLYGHSVKGCGTAQSAIQSTDEFKPDLIILELQLPVHNGIEFLYELRSYDDWQDLPVIIHSQVSPTSKAIGPGLWRQLGIKTYLYKPLTKLIDLANAVDALVLTQP